MNDKIQTLNQGLNALSQVLTAVNLAWTNNPEVAAAQSGPDGMLWASVKDNMLRCTLVIKSFQKLLDKVPVNGSSCQMRHQFIIASLGE